MQRGPVVKSAVIVIELASKRTRAILLCRWEKHLTVFFSAWRPWQALDFSHISIKTKKLK